MKYPPRRRSGRSRRRRGFTRRRRFRAKGSGRDTLAFGRVWDSSASEERTDCGRADALRSTLAWAPSTTTRSRVRRARGDRREKSFFFSVRWGFREAESRSCASQRESRRRIFASRRAKRARRIFAGHLCVFQSCAPGRRRGRRDGEEANQRRASVREGFRSFVARRNARREGSRARRRGRIVRGPRSVVRRGSFLSFDSTKSW